MRKVVLQMQLTIDGFVGGPNGEIDWVFKSMDDGATAWIVEHVWRAGVHIMGSRTYRDMAAHWPSSIEPFAAPMNEIPKVVFSRSRSPSVARGRPTTRALEDTSRYEQSRGTASGAVAASVAEGWATPRVASRDLTEEIMRLKREPGKEILAHGGAAFARSLVGAGLVDEYRLLVHPVALGSGLPLFSGLAQPMDLVLVSATPFSSGTIAQVYRSA